MKEEYLNNTGWKHYVPEGDWRDRDRGTEGWLKGYCRADSVDEAFDAEISKSY